jgi:hypothetical protein
MDQQQTELSTSKTTQVLGGCLLIEGKGRCKNSGNAPAPIHMKTFLTLLAIGNKSVDITWLLGRY